MIFNAKVRDLGFKFANFLLKFIKYQSKIMFKLTQTTNSRSHCDTRGG